MEITSTTATAAEKLKRLAKTLRKTTGTSLAVALDNVAKQHGYEHWKHVTACVEKTASLNHKKPLPESLQNLLDAAARSPASADSQKAFTQGFVFAIDVKDAEDLSLTSDYAECEDGWYFAAKDLWQTLVHYRDDETGTTLFETQSPEDLVSTVLDDLQNYRMFRYLGATAPASLQEAYKQIRQLSFFPPTHIWLSGKFIDIGEVKEIRIDDQVALSRSPGFTVTPSTEKRMVISNITIDINKDAPGVYTARAMSGGVLVTDPEAYDRIENAIRSEARNIPEDFAYFVEFTYGGMSTGTLTISDAITRAGQLADRLIELVAEEHRIMGR